MDASTHSGSDPRETAVAGLLVVGAIACLVLVVARVLGPTASPSLPMTGATTAVLDGRDGRAPVPSANPAPAPPEGR